MGIRIRWRGKAGTASWSDRGIGQPVRQCAYQELTYTAYGKAEESKGVTSISAVSYERAKTVVERERKNGTRKRCEHFRRSLRQGENGRNRTQQTRDRKVGRHGDWPSRLPNITKNQQQARVETVVNWIIRERQTTEHPKNTKSRKTLKH